MNQILRIDHLPDLSMFKYPSRWGSSAYLEASQALYHTLELLEADQHELVLRYQFQNS
jgi:hypothetical protein